MVSILKFFYLFMLYVSISHTPVRGPFLVRKSFYCAPRSRKNLLLCKSLQISVLKSIILGHFIYETVRNPKKIWSYGPQYFFYQLFGPPNFFSVFLGPQAQKVWETLLYMYTIFFSKKIVQQLTFFKTFVDQLLFEQSFIFDLKVQLLKDNLYYIYCRFFWFLTS
jgi:hypothetical protein